MERSLHKILPKSIHPFLPGNFWAYCINLSKLNKAVGESKIIRFSKFHENR